MKYTTVLVALIFLVLPAYAQIGIDFDGRMYGDGYINENLVFVNDSRFISESVNYTGENRLIVEGEFSNLSVKIQTGNSDMTQIKEERSFRFMSEGEKKFDRLKGDRVRFVIQSKESATVERVELYEKSIYEKIPYGFILLVVGLIVVGFYILTEYI